jgi:hypothetical protein
VLGVDLGEILSDINAERRLAVLHIDNMSDESFAISRKECGCFYTWFGSAGRMIT